MSDLQLLLDLTDHQWGMVLSADQNGHFMVIPSEAKDAAFLVADGLFVMHGDVTAKLTPKASRLLDLRRKERG